MGYTTSVSFAKHLILPDWRKIERFAKAPQLGPKLLFFSGGSALFSLSRLATLYTHHSIHIITPFDSGGSSAEIRKHFGMFAIGDLRHRLMALADQSISGNPEVYQLFSTRLNYKASQEELEQELQQLIKGQHELIKALPDPLRKIIRNHLLFFRKAMPKKFDLRGASLGNLILVGGFVNNRRQIDPTLYLFSKLVEARGIVRPITTNNLDLVVRYQYGSEVVGQHKITGKESQAKKERIEDIYLIERLPGKNPKLILKNKVAKLIESAELICYPMGSFYSSLICQFLVPGVAEVIAKNPSPKVYIPNWGDDPEEYGLDLKTKVSRLLEVLKGQTKKPLADSDLLDFIIIDSQAGAKLPKKHIRSWKDQGIQVIDADLVDSGTSGRIDPKKLLPLLLSLT